MKIICPPQYMLNLNYNVRKNPPSMTQRMANKWKIVFSIIINSNKIEKLEYWIFWRLN